MVQTLTSSCQAQHQEMLALRQEQGWCFQVLLESQAQDRVAFKDLLQSASALGGMGGWSRRSH